MHIAEQIGSVIVGLIFVWFAGKFLHKEKVGMAFALLVIAGAFFFCSFSSVQAFIKTGILWKVDQKLTEYGDKIDGFQTSVSDMRDDLGKQQVKIMVAQSNLDDVEYWVQNLYGKMTNEGVSMSDTNRVLTVPKTNNVTLYIVRLEHAVIPGSVLVSFGIDASRNRNS